MWKSLYTVEFVHMSRDSEETNLNPKDSENAVSEDNLKETEQLQKDKKTKRNFCYVCHVQCSGDRNFLDHQQGKKHLKNAKVLEEAKTAAQVKIISTRKEKIAAKRAARRTDHRTHKNTKKKPPKNSDESKVHEVPKSTSSDQLPNENMSNFNRYNSKKNKYQYINPNYDNKYSRYQNPRNSNSNNYRNQRHYFNDAPFIPQWNQNFPNSPLILNVPDHNYGFGPENQYFLGPAYNGPHGNEYFSGHNFHNTYGNYSEQPLQTAEPTGDSIENFNCPSFNDTSVENSETKQCDANSSSSGHASKCTKKYYSEDVPSSVTSNGGQIDRPSASKSDDSIDTAKNDRARSKEASNFLKIVLDFHNKKRIRSRSLSASESGGENKGKDNENQANSDDASEEQRIQKWTNSILETSNQQISRLLNPSTFKEKAAVNHLITKLSKSKRKEILARTLRSNSLESENNDEISNTEDANVNASTEELSLILDSKEKSSDIMKKDYSPTIQKNKKKYSKNRDSEQDLISDSLNDIGSIKSPVNHSSKKANKKGKDSNVTSSKVSLDSNKEKNVKRKSSGNDIHVKLKKQKSNRTESLERSNMSKTSEILDLNKDIPSADNSTNPSENTETSNHIPSDVLDYFKEELFVPTEAIIQDAVNQVLSSTAMNSSNTQNQNLMCNSEISLDTLIQLFASGNVKVKEEFNDPVMEAIKTISSDELINACSGEILNPSKTPANKTPVDSNRRNSKDKPAPDTSLNIVQENMDDINHNNLTIPGSANVHENTSSQSIPNLSSSDKSDDHVCPSSSSNNVETSDSSLSEMKKLNLLSEAKSDMPPPLNKLIKKLNDIASQEEMVQQHLAEAKSKISEYQAILEEWKSKKKRLQSQEEDLRKQRNDIIKSMQIAVKKNDEGSEEEQTSSSQEEVPVFNQPVSSKKKKLKENVPVANCSENLHSPSSTPSPAKHQKQKKKDSQESSESDEILILPVPSKPKPPEIIIVDDFEENMSTAPCSSLAASNGIATNVISNKGPSLYDTKNVNAHSTIINSMMVFEDFIYTCSNDSTAKRFSIKDPSQTIVYLHTVKNVTEIVVEKIQHEALVFTSSAKLLSLFIASSGTKIKTFLPPAPVLSICKGWGKFYSALANGSVNVYNWKYEEIEIVKTETPASRIATAHQGRLHVLVILSSEGHVFIRDAETGLLIRPIRANARHPSWMVLHNDMVYLSSSEKVLFILDIMSGRVEKRLYFNSHTTGLAVYDDYIFTISYSGIINCYNKDKSSDKKLFYGAGKSGLTCIHVYQNWVFTGNRKGDVSLFQFDPNSILVCEFGKCDMVFGLKEDLAFHIEKDHLSKRKLLLRCIWHACDFTFHRGSETLDKMNHIQTHFY